MVPFTENPSPYLLCMWFKATRRRRIPNHARRSAHHESYRLPDFPTSLSTAAWISALTCSAVSSKLNVFVLGLISDLQPQDFWKRLKYVTKFLSTLRQANRSDRATSMGPAKNFGICEISALEISAELYFPINLFCRRTKQIILGLVLTAQTNILTASSNNMSVLDIILCAFGFFILSSLYWVQNLATWWRELPAHILLVHPTKPSLLGFNLAPLTHLVLRQNTILPLSASFHLCNRCNLWLKPNHFNNRVIGPGESAFVVERIPELPVPQASHLAGCTLGRGHI